MNAERDCESSNVILYAVFFYVRYSLSYRYLQEMKDEHGPEIDHATLNGWVFSILTADCASDTHTQTPKPPT